MGGWSADSLTGIWFWFSFEKPPHFLSAFLVSSLDDLTGTPLPPLALHCCQGSVLPADVLSEMTQTSQREICFSPAIRFCPPPRWITSERGEMRCWAVGKLPRDYLGLLLEMREKELSWGVKEGGGGETLGRWNLAVMAV